MIVHIEHTTTSHVILLNPYCNGFEITFVSEKDVVEDDVLFTSHLAGK